MKMIKDTVLRESVLNWYEFRKNSTLLQIGADKCPLTELFARRCASVTALVSDELKKEELQKSVGSLGNVHVCTQNEEMETDKTYTYIVCMDELEYSDVPVESLRKWYSQLETEGTLLLGVDNRFGLKYFCGSKEKHTGVPFDGINGYMREELLGKGRSYSRNEICNLLKEAGISKYKFYYPVPDNRMPQMIFTDAYQKGINAAERLIDYNYEDSSMLGVEHRIFREMIDGGALAFMSNSFLIEITKDGELSDIDYAVVTTDRGADYAMATTIRDSGYVRKRPIWQAGERTLHQLFGQTKELAAKNIPVVEMNWKTDDAGAYVEMPFVNKEGLSAVLEKYSETDTERFMRVFDQIHTYMKKSYEENEHSGRVFLDLAPCNAFLDGR